MADKWIENTNQITAIHKKISKTQQFHKDIKISNVSLYYLPMLINTILPVIWLSQPVMYELKASEIP